MIEASPVLKQFRPQLLIDITPEGLRIQIVDSSNRPMFDRSSAVVVSYMRTILREISPVSTLQPNKITLSGPHRCNAVRAGRQVLQQLGTVR